MKTKKGFKKKRIGWIPYGHNTVHKHLRGVWLGCLSQNRIDVAPPAYRKDVVEFKILPVYVEIPE